MMHQDILPNYRILDCESWFRKMDSEGRYPWVEQLGHLNSQLQRLTIDVLWNWTESADYLWDWDTFWYARNNLKNDLGSQLVDPARATNIWRDFVWKPPQHSQKRWEKIQGLSAQAIYEWEWSELFRWNYGLWVLDPALKDLESTDVEELARDQGLGAVAYLVMGPTDYFHLTSNKVFIADSSGVAGRMGYFRRHLSVYTLIWDCLLEYPLNSREDRKNMVIDKARGAAYSTTMASLMLRKAIVSPGILILNILPDETRAKETAQKMNRAWNVMPEWFKSKHTFKDKTTAGVIGGSKPVLRIARKRGNDVLISEIFWDLAEIEKVTGFRPALINIDEKGKIDRVNILDLLQNAMGALKSMGPRQACFIMSGTSEPADEDGKTLNQNAAALWDIVDNPAMFQTLYGFMGAQHTDFYNEADGIYSGYNDLQAAYDYTKQYVEEGEEAAKSGSASMAQMAIRRRMEYPLRREDCYLSTRDAERFDPERVDAQMEMVQGWQQTGRRVNMEGEDRAFTLRKGYFVFPTPDNPYHVEFIRTDESDKQFWQLTKEPYQQGTPGRPSTVYVAGVDPADAQVNASQLAKAGRSYKTISNMSCVVLHTQTGEPVAIYQGRHTSPQIDWEQMLAGVVYYNCKVNPETNKSGFTNYLTLKREDGSKPYIPYCWRWPKKVKTYADPGDNGFGTRTGMARVQYLETYLRPYLDEHLEQIPFLNLLKELREFSFVDKTKSKDTVMALLMATMIRRYIIATGLHVAPETSSQFLEAYDRLANYTPFYGY